MEEIEAAASPLRLADTVGARLVLDNHFLGFILFWSFWFSVSFGVFEGKSGTGI